MWVVEEAIAAAPEGARNRSTSSIGNNFFKSQLRRHGAHLEQSDVAFGRHLSVSLPELPKKTSSEPTQNTRSASPSPHLSTSLPNLTKYDSSGGCGQSIASPGRIRNKSFAQRALALTPSVIKRQKRRAGVNALNNFGQASISRSVQTNGKSHAMPAYLAGVLLPLLASIALGCRKRLLDLFVSENLCSMGQSSHPGNKESTIYFHHHCLAESRWPPRRFQNQAEFNPLRCLISWRLKFECWRLKGQEAREAPESPENFKDARIFDLSCWCCRCR